MFLVIDNYDSFTFNLVQAFYELGITPQVVRNDRQELLDYAQAPELEGVCIAPGPGRPEQAGLCLEFLRRLPPPVPVLGVCLGHQVLACFAQAPVVVGERIVHGKASEIHHDGQGLFQGLPNPLQGGRYHSLLVQADQARLPLAITARSEAGEVMALAFPDRPWMGVQFHPESVLTPQGVDILDNFLALVDPARRKQSPAAASALTPPALADIIETLLRGEDLSPAMAQTGFARLMDGEMTPAQAGAFLIALRAKGETPEEMNAAVNAVLERALPVSLPPGPPVLDVVGTGGDGSFSFNCSSATALILAALGYRIVKHGNRSVSSKCGSADVLEGLGFDLALDAQDIPARLAQDNFAFLFAPRFHPAFRHVMPVRRELGVRTLFNLLGPLVNPARPGLCFLGVAQEHILPLVAGTLARMEGRSGAVVYGAGGYDELTTLGPAKVALVGKGQVRYMEIDPARYGFSPAQPPELAISGPEEGVAVLRQLLAGQGPAPMREMLALNVGFALHLLRPQSELAACMEEGKKAVASGVGWAHLQQIMERRPQQILN
jgi:anthranilate synthase/phosphoribosyltransferase